MERMSEWIEAAVGPSALGPRWAVVSERFAPRLLTRHERIFELAARDTKLGKETFARELPNAIVPASSSTMVDTRRGHLRARVEGF